LSRRLSGAIAVGKVHFNTFEEIRSDRDGKAVLEVIEKEKLQENWLKQGTRIGWSEVEGEVSNIGDVRGKGLMLGVEMVKDRTTK
jgi:4-aminobutyrate aminotransferase-like enzyme